MMRAFQLPQLRACSVLSILFGMSLLLTACASSTGTTTQGGSATNTPPAVATATAAPVTISTDLCSIMSAADASTIIGSPISIVIPVGGTAVQNGVKRTLCGYGTDTSSPPKVDLFYYLVVQGDPQADFAQLKQQAANPTAIANLGDAAFWKYAAPKTPTDAPYSVFVLRGTLFFGIGMPGNADQTNALSLEQQIATFILAHL